MLTDIFVRDMLRIFFTNKKSHYISNSDILYLQFQKYHRNLQVEMIQVCIHIKFERKQK